MTKDEVRMTKESASATPRTDYVPGCAPGQPGATVPAEGHGAERWARYDAMGKVEGAWK